MKTTFPNFTHLSTRQDYHEYQLYISQFPQHSDYTLNNLLVWMSADTTIEYSWLNDNAVLRVSEPLYEAFEDKVWYTIVGISEADKSLDTIFKTTYIRQLKYVPDYFMESISNPEKYIITEDPPNHDYVINIKSLLKREGKTYEDFRYQLRYFLKNYSEDVILRDLDITEKATQKEIIGSLKRWRNTPSFEATGNDPERIEAKALLRLMILQSSLPNPHHCIGLYIHGELEGFSIYQIPPAKDKIAMGNHIKFNGKYRKIFDFLAFATASRLNMQGIELLNVEQDMGIEGLRRHKLGLNPFTLYKKYFIQPVS